MDEDLTKQIGEGVDCPDDYRHKEEERETSCLCGKINRFREGPKKQEVEEMSRDRANKGVE